MLNVYIYSMMYIIYKFSCSIAANCNRQKYQAKRAGEQSNELYLAVYIGLHGPLVEEAVVTDVKDFSFDVIVCSTGQVQRIYTNVSTPQSRVQIHLRLHKFPVTAILYKFCLI
jgi:exoribonuclease R